MNHEGNQVEEEGRELGQIICNSKEFVFNGKAKHFFVINQLK